LGIGLQGPEGYPPTWGFTGVAVGPSGAIYITGDVAGVLYRIWPRLPAKQPPAGRGKGVARF